MKKQKIVVIKKLNPKKVDDLDRWVKKFKDDLQQYFLRGNGRLRAGSINNYLVKFMLFINYIKNKNINFWELNNRNIEDVLEQIRYNEYITKTNNRMSSSVKSKSYSDSSLRLLIVSVSRFYKFLIKNSIVDINPLKGLTIKKVKNEDIAKVESKLLSVIEIDKVFQFIENLE